MEAVAPERKYIIGGNWKCNGTLQSVKDLIEKVLNKAEFDQSRVDVVVAPVSIHIASVKALLNENIKVGCQNVSQTGKGAYTGEISCDQLKDFDVNWIIIGHSERRSLYAETDAIVAAKTAQAQELGLSTIICIGEMLEDREGGSTNQVLAT
jgi:triosephosphate isomerase